MRGLSVGSVGAWSACTILAVLSGGLGRGAAQAGAPERYSAIEGGPESAVEGEVSPRQPVAVAPPKAKRAEVTPPAAKPGVPDSKVLGFEPVPSDQLGAFEKRVELVGKILQEFGRAYDYRTLRVAELQAVYDGLKQEARTRFQLQAKSGAGESAPEESAAL